MLGSYKVSNLGYCSQCLIPSASPQIHVKPTVFLTLMVATNTVVCSVSLKISQKGIDYRQSDIPLSQLWSHRPGKFGSVPQRVHTNWDS